MPIIATITASSMKEWPPQSPPLLVPIIPLLIVGLAILVEVLLECSKYNKSLILSWGLPFHHKEIWVLVQMLDTITTSWSLSTVSTLEPALSATLNSSLALQMFQAQALIIPTQLTIQLAIPKRFKSISMDAPSHSFGGIQQVYPLVMDLLHQGNISYSTSRFLQIPRVETFLRSATTISLSQEAITTNWIAEDGTYKPAAFITLYPQLPSDQQPPYPPFPIISKEWLNYPSESLH